MRILHIDDDKRLREGAKKVLERRGLVVDLAADAKSGVLMAGERTYAVILLDIGMPGLDGFWALKTLRQAGNPAGIFMITGKGGNEEKIKAFEAGADDYIVKPFFAAEVAARVIRYIQRNKSFVDTAASVDSIVVADLRLEIKAHRAVRGATVIPLTRKEYGILFFLMNQPGQVHTHYDILQAVWNDDFEGLANTVEFHIKNLREKIDKDFTDKLIKTVRGTGYMIEDPTKRAK